VPELTEEQLQVLAAPNETSKPGIDTSWGDCETYEQEKDKQVEKATDLK